MWVKISVVTSAAYAQSAMLCLKTTTKTNCNESAGGNALPLAQTIQQQLPIRKGGWGVVVRNPCQRCVSASKLLPRLYHVKAVEDYCRYAGRDEEAHEEEEYAQHPRAQAVASAAGKFLRYGGMRHAPAYKQRGDKGAKGQQYVGGQRV